MLLAKQYLFMGIIAPLCLLIPAVTGIVYRRFFTASLHYLWFYFILTFIFNVITKIMAQLGMANLLVFHVYTLIEFLLLMRFFFLLFENHKIKLFIRFLLFLFPAYCIVVYAFFQDARVFNTYTKPVEALSFISLCLLYWWQQTKIENDISWAKIPLNWIISGILLYFSSAFFLFIFSNLLATHASLATNTLIWNIHAGLLIIMCLFCAAGFYLCKP